MRRAPAFPAASSVGVARSPRVGVPSILSVASGGWWVCAGVIRTASDACFGGVCWGVRPRVSWGIWWGWGGAGPPVVACPSRVWVVAPVVVPFSSVLWSPLPPLPGSWVVSCPHVVSVPASCPCECLPSLGAPPCPLACVLLGVPCPSLALVLPLRPRPGGGWPGATGGGLGGCMGGRRPWTASRRRASHAACGMMASGAASLGFAGVRAHTSSRVCTMCTPSCLPAPPAHFTQRRSSCRAGGDHQARPAGAWGGGGVRAGGPGAAGGGRGPAAGGGGWRCLGEGERRWRGLGVEDGYRRRGEREGEVDMGRRWLPWWCPGEWELWWRGLGVVDGYGRRGERGAWRGMWGEGEVDVGRRRRA